jgi:DNA-binding MarR family transcriptional regulator
VTKLSPEQWRVLDYLYQHKLNTNRPKMVHVRSSQKSATLTCST